LGVKAKFENLYDRAQTGAAIYKSAEYFRDLGNYLDLSLSDFFDFVRRIPYLEDSEPTELVARPQFLIHKKHGLKGLDCKKKAVLMGAWFNAHNTPWRLVAVSERPDKQIHHVFPQFFDDNGWQNADATYPDYRLFDRKPNVTHAEILI